MTCHIKNMKNSLKFGIAKQNKQKKVLGGFPRLILLMEQFLYIIPMMISSAIRKSN